MATSGEDVGADGHANVGVLDLLIVYSAFVDSRNNGLPLQPSQPASLAHCINGN
jgi:hypothetical protein